MIMLILILGVAAAAILLYYSTHKCMYYWLERGVTQGKSPWLLGDTWKNLLQLESTAELTNRIYNRFPGARCIGPYQFFTPTLIVKDPELIKKISVKDFEHFTDHRAFVPENADPLWAKNLFALKGEKWREMRSIVSPSFTSSKMKTIFELMTECAENFIRHFQKKEEELVTVEMTDVFSAFANDVIATTAFGVKTDSLAVPNNKFYLMAKDAADFSSFWKNFKFFGYFFCPRLYEIFKVKIFSSEVAKFFTELIREAIQVRKEKRIVRHDMLNLLMEAQKETQTREENDKRYATAQEPGLGEEKTPKELSIQDITSQALIFFIAGFDTASTMMCWTSYELALNPDVQEKLRNEINETLEECGGKLTYEGLLNMKYMDMVVSETLRKWPNIVAVDRVCTKPYTIEPTTPEENPIYIEEGTPVWFPAFALHRDPKYYPNPDRFDPERFGDKNKGNIVPYTYLPFGLGPRNCVGSRFALMELKVLFFYIVLNFEIQPVKGTMFPMEISKKRFTLNAAGGFYLGLKRI